LEEAVRRCLIVDMRDCLDPAAAIRRLRKEAGSDAVRAERAKLTRQLAGLVDIRHEAEALVLTRRRDHAWLDAKDAELRAAEDAIAVRLAALPVVVEGAELEARWMRMRTMREVVAGWDGEALGQALGSLGVVVVSGAGVTIAYDGPWTALVPEPVTVVPRQVKR
jgi:hypothetical protein